MIAAHILTSLPMDGGSPFVMVPRFRALPPAHGSEQQSIRVARALLCVLGVFSGCAAELGLSISEYCWTGVGEEWQKGHKPAANGTRDG